MDFNVEIGQECGMRIIDREDFGLVAESVELAAGRQRPIGWASVDWVH